MNPWKPVATAPRDRHILLANFTEINGQMLFQWAASGTLLPHDDKKAWIDIFYTEVETDGFREVTHWQNINLGDQDV